MFFKECYILNTTALMKSTTVSWRRTFGKNSRRNTHEGAALYVLENKKKYVYAKFIKRLQCLRAKKKLKPHSFRLTLSIISWDIQRKKYNPLKYKASKIWLVKMAPVSCLFTFYIFNALYFYGLYLYALYLNWFYI
jgi:hypothetical protein